MLKDEQNRSGRKVVELREAFYNAGGKLDVFEAIHEKINTVDAERLAQMERTDYERHLLSDRIAAMEEDNERNNKQAENIKAHTANVQNELVELKDSYQRSSDGIIGQIELINKRMIADFTTVRDNLT